jgi:Zn finger protein HypA/HybF involved in hydrogenase expression
MSNKWKGAVIVNTAHHYTVNADSYEEARELIFNLFAEGVLADKEDVECYTQNGQVECGRCDTQNVSLEENS